MSPRETPAVVIARRRDVDGLPVTDPRLRRALSDDEVVRVAPGSFARGHEWRALSPMDRHHARVIETMDRVHRKYVIGYHAAAAIWGIDKIGTWPDRIDVIVPRTGGGRSSGLLRRRTTVATDVQTVTWRGHEVTTPAQTVLDLARVSGFTTGLVAADQALWARRLGGALASAAELAELFAAAQPRRGDARAQRMLEFASSLADSVRETQSRSFIHQLGFPEPELQHRFTLPSGRRVRTDFWFPEFAHVGEFDGVGKYLDPELLHGRTPEQSLIEEKDRADELRRIVRRVSRWRTPVLRDPRLLYDVLAGDGLPSTRPRPPRGLILR